MKESVKKYLPIIGFTAGIYSVISQWIIILLKAEGTGNTIITETVHYYSYMTVWTNLMVTLCFGAVTIFKNSSWANFFRSHLVQTGTVVYITVVGLAYHLLLSAIFNPTGLEWFGNLLLHYINPILYIIFWILIIEKKNLPYAQAFRWLAFPIAYFVYSLTRGLITDWYPYYFVDITKLGFAQLMAISALLLSGYALIGIVVIYLSRLSLKSSSIPNE